MNYIYQLKKKDFKVYLLAILTSFYLFFWDVKIYNNFGLRETIVIAILFIFNENINNKFFFKKNKINLIFILAVCLLIFIHQILNTLFDGSSYTSHNFLGTLGLFFLTFFIFYYYELILNKFNFIVNFFCIIFIISYFFSDIELSSKWELENLCSSTFKFDNKFIFLENSHLGMMIGSVLGYYLFKVRLKNIFYLIVIYLSMLFLILLEPSTTLYFSLTVSLFLVTIYDFKFFIKKNIFFILIFLLTLYFNNLNNNCYFKIVDTVKGLNSVVNIDQNKGVQEKTIPEKKIKEKKIEDIRNLPVKDYDLFIRLNLSSAVFLNSLNIALETSLSRPVGWGLNRYENAFDYYLSNEIIIPYLYHEVYTLNYNDGSANLSKLFTEFGVLALILIPIILSFVFTKNMSNENKIFFLSIIFTQLVRGAGYFNGGFLFSLIIIIFTTINIKKNYAKN